MIHPEISGGIARARRQSRLAAAAAARRAQQPRGSRRPGQSAAAAGHPAVLGDGSAVLIRPVRRGDALLLADGFARLSAQSRWMRFLGAKRILTPTELRYLTEVDHHDHEALGALTRGTGLGVGVARYIRDAADPQSAEVAVTVVDDWQRRGLATELLARLSGRACAEGIGRFTALVAADNRPATGLLRTMGAIVVHRDTEAVEYELPLTGSRRRDLP